MSADLQMRMKLCPRSGQCCQEGRSRRQLRTECHDCWRNVIPPRIPSCSVDNGPERCDRCWTARNKRFEIISFLYVGKFLFCAHQKRVRAVATGDTAHARHGGHWRCHWAGGQIDDALAIGSGTSDALRWALADQEAIARAAHVLLAWGSIPNGLQGETKNKGINCCCCLLLESTHSCLIAVGALDHMLLTFGCYVNHVLTHPTGDHGHATGAAALIGRWQLIGPNERHKLCWAACKERLERGRNQ